MLKKFFFILFILPVFTAVSQSQNQAKPHSDCEFGNKITGAWVIQKVLTDLSGEVLEEEGQTWEMSGDEEIEIKDKMKMTFFPDGSFSGEITFEEETETAYGYWKTSPDCRQMIITVDGIDETLEIFSVEANRLVLEMKEDEESVKMIFTKFAPAKSGDQKK